MVYFCLSSSSQPSSRCIINVENPPSAHAQRRHEDNDFHLRCAPVITKSSVFFVSGPAFLSFRRLPQPRRHHCFSLMAVSIFYTTGSLENGADLHPACHCGPQWATWCWSCQRVWVTLSLGAEDECRTFTVYPPAFQQSLDKYLTALRSGPIGSLAVSLTKVFFVETHMEGCIKGAVCCTAPL